MIFALNGKFSSFNTLITDFVYIVDFVVIDIFFKIKIPIHISCNKLISPAVLFHALYVTAHLLMSDGGHHN